MSHIVVHSEQQCALPGMMPQPKKNDQPTLFDPTSDEINLFSGEWIALLRHAVVFIVGGDEQIELAFVRATGGDDGGLAVAKVGQLLVVDELVLALRFLCTVAAEAVLGEDGRNFVSKADRVVVVGGGRFFVSRNEADQNELCQEYGDRSEVGHRESPVRTG